LIYILEHNTGVLFGFYGLISEIFHKEKESKFLLLSDFIPCTGVMSVLLSASLLRYKASLLGIVFFISSRVFAILLLIILLEKSLHSHKLLSLNKAFLLSSMIVLGSYKSYNSLV